MRSLIGFLTGILGMLAGWFGLAMLVIALAGPDRDGGIAMGAFFQIGPLGGVLGFILGVFLFMKLGQKRTVATAAGTSSGPGTSPVRRSVSPVFAIVVLVVAAGLAWWGWYTFIRSPYLSHGFMTLSLQFKLPPELPLPPTADDVHISIYEGNQQTDFIFGPRWHSTEGDANVIFGQATLSLKTKRRAVAITLPGISEEQWQINLPNDPDPMTGFSDWQMPVQSASQQIQMKYQLGADQ